MPRSRVVPFKTPPDAADSARSAGLRYTTDRRPGIRRVRNGSGFRYVGTDGKPVRADDVRRIRALVIPPAWTGVWICTDPRGHLQATGRDARGRKQYRFQYYDEDGERHAIGSGDVNAYLKEITGEEYTSKDLRTWAGTVLAAEILRGCGPCRSDAHGKKTIVQAVEKVAGELRNTKAVCRKCYIHPAVLEAYLDGSIAKPAPPTRRKVRTGALSEAEALVLALLQRRLARGAGLRDYLSP